MTTHQRELFRQVAMLLLQASDLLVQILEKPQDPNQQPKREW